MAQAAGGHVDGLSFMPGAEFFQAQTVPIRV